MEHAVINTCLTIKIETIAFETCIGIEPALMMQRNNLSQIGIDRINMPSFMYF